MPPTASINAGGAWAKTVAASAGLDIPVVPDSHEAGVTEPMAAFMRPMVVDIRPAAGSKNYYFYQHRPGAVVFCITPEPPIVGTDRRETSEYLPMIARRMVGLMPRLANIKVRRTWRGLYPMTPDGSPIVGWAASVQGYVHAVGMCGQGYMLGPGRRRAGEPDGGRDDHGRRRGNPAGAPARPGLRRRRGPEVDRRQIPSGQSHAAPRTPLESPCAGGRRAVSTRSENTHRPQSRGTES